MAFETAVTSPRETGLRPKIRTDKRLRASGSNMSQIRGGDDFGSSRSWAGSEKPQSNGPKMRYESVEGGVKSLVYIAEESPFRSKKRYVRFLLKGLQEGRTGKSKDRWKNHPPHFRSAH